MPASACARAKLSAARGDLDDGRSDVAAARIIFAGMGKGGERHLQSLNAVLDPIGPG